MRMLQRFFHWEKTSVKSFIGYKLERTGMKERKSEACGDKNKYFDIEIGSGEKHKKGSLKNGKSFVAQDVGDTRKQQLAWRKEDFRIELFSLSLLKKVLNAKIKERKRKTKFDFSTHFQKSSRIVAFSTSSLLSLCHAEWVNLKWFS